MPILKRNGKTFSGTPTKVDTAKSYTTFDSADDKNPTTWSDVELLTSKEEQRSLFSKISTMFKNIRYLYKMLGTTDISNIGDGTVTGGIDAIGNVLGSTDISAIGDGTVTGGLNALNSNFSNLIKTHTETLTTNENGIFLISLNIDRPLLAIKCITNNDIALIPYSNENAGYGNWVVSSFVSYSFTKFSNQTITVKYWYI